jgi:predicted esterase
MSTRFFRSATMFCLAVDLAYIAAALSAMAAEPVAFDGQWRTSIGTVNLKQAGSEITGTYGSAGQFSLKGQIDGKKLTFEYREGEAAGEAQWTLDESGHSFHGQYQLRRGQKGIWEGWRADPEAPNAPPANFGGLWLTDLGLMELEQRADKVTGRYAVQGVSTIESTARGRTLDFQYKSFGAGKGWFDVSADGATIAGAANNDGSAVWYGWRGRRATEFARHAPLEAGKIVDGSTKNLLTYSARAPEGYQQGDDKKWPTIVILHGSNMSGRAYVNTIAVTWPDIAKEHLLIGINGERPSAIGNEPGFNYTYVDYVGRSTFKGFPGTDRESPALVAEAMVELRDVYPIARYFVGGHSQGGFLTYSLLMNFPDQIAGAFAISAGVVFQCEPIAYTDDALRIAQRSVPLAIIHAQDDPFVPFSSGEYAASVFGDAGWPAFRFFADDSQAGHMFARLPVGQAIRWLEAQTSDDPARLIDFAEERMKALGGYRDAVAALNRARRLKPADPAVNSRLHRLAEEIDAKATSGAKKFLPAISSTDGKSWIDEFLAFRDDFEFAPAAHEVMEAFNSIRAKHEGPAKTALDDARAAFQHGKPEEGYKKYQEIVDKYYAASSYRNAKRWLAERK